MATVPRLQRYYQGATTSCPRMSFGLLFSPAGSAGACRVRVRPERSRRRTGPATDRGLDFSCWQSPFQRPCPRARAGSPRFPGDPSRDFAPVHDPGRPVAPHQSRRFRCCPHTLRTLIKIKFPTSSWAQLVIPVAVELVSMERQGGHLCLRYHHSGRVLSLVELGFDPKPRGRSRIAYQVDNSLKGP